MRNYNVIGLTDASGELVERYEYSPYGQRTVYRSYDSNDPLVMAPVFESQSVVADGTAQPYGLCDIGHQGLYHDKEFQLVYNRARYLSPRLRRFLQCDPLGYIDGPSLYAYVGNNPINLKDPLGLWYIDINISFNYWGGVTAGLLISGRGVYGYVGGGVMGPPPAGASVTWSPFDPTTGWNVGLQGGMFGVGGQGGYGFGGDGGWFGEIGLSTPGGSLTGYYVVGLFPWDWDDEEWDDDDGWWDDDDWLDDSDTEKECSPGSW